MYPFSGFPIEKCLSPGLGAVSGSRIEPILYDFGILDEPDVKQVQANMRITVKSGSDREVIIARQHQSQHQFYL